MLEIKLIRPSDKNSVIEIINEYLESYVKTEKTYLAFLDPRIGEVYWQEIQDSKDDYVVLIAIDNGKIIGFCIGEIHHYGPTERLYFREDRVGEVWDFYVKADFRGQGIGEKILENMEKEFKDRGCKNMLLNGVEIHNEKAIRLYERLGYKPWSTKYYKALY